jgi:peptidoglycan L-alanyl-D-glutamate endopeptidase CwlK
METPDELLQESATMRTIQPVHPKLMRCTTEIFRRMKFATGLDMRITWGFRSVDTQAEIYSKGRTSMGEPCPCKIKPCQKHPFGLPVTNASPIRSFHAYGIAVDTCFQGMDPYLVRHLDADHVWDLFGMYAKQANITWGGDFKFHDACHIELSLGLSIDDVIALCAGEGIGAVWREIDARLGEDTSLDWPDTFPVIDFERFKTTP